MNEAESNPGHSRDAVTTGPSGVNLLLWLGRAYAIRYENTRHLHDITLAIEHLNQAVTIVEDVQDKEKLLFQVGRLHHTRFHTSRAIEDIDKAVNIQAQIVANLPDQHGSHVEYLAVLGNSLACRFEHTGNLDDIQLAIECLSLADLGSPGSHPDKLMILRDLGKSYLSQFTHLGRLSDVNESINYYTQALKYTSQTNADMPQSLSDLGSAYNDRFNHLGDLEDIDKAIDYLTQAVGLTPDNDREKHIWLINLGNSYYSRFSHVGKLVDIDRAIESQSQAVSLVPDDDLNKPRWLNNLGNSYNTRFYRLGDLSDINKAVEFLTQSVQLIPDEHLERPRSLSNLGTSHRLRFGRLGEPHDIDRGIDCHTQAVRLTPDGHSELPHRLGNLGESYLARFKQLGEQIDIDQAVECHTRAVLLTPEGRTELPRYLSALGDSKMLLGGLSNADQAVECYMRAVSLTPEGHAAKSNFLHDLGKPYQHRFEHTKDPEDIHKATCCFQQATQNPAGSPRDRFKAAEKWARLLAQRPGASPLVAYSAAMDLVPELVWLGTTITHRYQTVSLIGTITTEAVAAAIAAHEYSLALEWLEGGRSIVWNQTQQLRSPLDDLFIVNPELSERLKKVANDLENASLRGSEGDQRSLEDATWRHHRLVEEYANLLEQVRSLPGFHNFLLPRRTPEIICAAQYRPVVVINVHTTRCDALVVSPGSNKVEHIALPELSHSEVAKLRAQTETTLLSMGFRERGFSNSSGGRRSDHLEHVLATLWHKAAKPIIDSLGCKVNQPPHKLPHITWCTTGDLAFLPIHAAGLYDRPHANVFDLFISSYTPTLSALLPFSSHPATPSTGILAVGQEVTAGCAPLPGTRTEIASIQKHAKDIPYTELQGDQATVKATLDAMEQSPCVHLACHASQNIADPTQSGFHLHDGTLSLAAIAGKSFKNKNLAFLSACQTAAGDKQLPDEAVHLAAGMLVAGYPSVIATMWSIHDSDAPLVADQVYAQLIQCGRVDSTEAAKALHAAVSRLRTEVGDKAFTRWVPYIHIGV